MNDNKFTRWHEHVTVGELLTAMVWTQGLVGALFSVYVSRNQTPDEKKKAVDDYQREWDEFSRKVDQIGGVNTDE